MRDTPADGSSTDPKAASTLPESNCSTAVSRSRPTDSTRTPGASVANSSRTLGRKRTSPREDIATVKIASELAGSKWRVRDRAWLTFWSASRRGA